jgi:NCS2 family nucleobase:cation symporter-2
LYDFMQRLGGQWGARAEVVEKATGAMDEFMESAAGQELTHDPVTMEVRFDEYDLDVDIRYRGRSIEFPEQHPSPRELLEDTDVMDRVAGHLIRRYADRLSASRQDDECRIRLHFEH